MFNSQIRQVWGIKYKFGVIIPHFQVFSDTPIYLQWNSASAIETCPVDASYTASGVRLSTEESPGMAARLRTASHSEALSLIILI